MCFVLVPNTAFCSIGKIRIIWLNQSYNCSHYNCLMHKNMPYDLNYTTHQFGLSEGPNKNNMKQKWWTKYVFPKSKQSTENKRITMGKLLTIVNF